MVIEPIKCLKDNYAFILHDAETNTTAVVDPSESQPVLDYLEKKTWVLNWILNTHHHWDHVGGNLELKVKTGCKVIGAKVDAARVPGIDFLVSEGDLLSVGKIKVEVLFIPGHTTGHIAYYFPGQKAVFCGDTLFSLGAGRLFEGTAEQLFHSLGKLKALPDDTKVYCGHEYTLSNAVFTRSLFPNSEKVNALYSQVMERLQRENSTIPSTIQFERENNVFLQCLTAQELSSLRKLKDEWTG